MDISLYYDNLLDGVVITDYQGVIQYCNDAVGVIFALQVRRLPGKPFQNFSQYSTGLVQKYENFVADSSARDFSSYSEMPLTDSQDVEKMIQAAVWKDTANKVLVIFIRDMTLEANLHSKYRQELHAKEDYIKMLDRKVFELQFLFELSTSTTSLEETDFNQHRIFEKILGKLPFKAIFSFKCESDKVSLDASHSQSSPREVREMINQTNNYLANLTFKSFPEGYVIREGENTTELLCFVQGQNDEFSVYAYIFDKTNKHLAAENAVLMCRVSQQVKLIVESQKFFQQSITDEKTKLFNQRYFKYRFEYELKRSERYKKEFAVIIFDIDFFKKVNDTHGHLVGDIALVEVADTIRNCVRNIDVASRFGGEEFAVIALEAADEGAMIVAERVRQKVSEIKIPVDGDGLLQMTISAGIAIFPRHGKTMHDLMEAADQALYKAKQSGRNRVIVAPN